MILEKKPSFHLRQIIQIIRKQKSMDKNSRKMLAQNMTILSIQETVHSTNLVGHNTILRQCNEYFSKPWGHLSFNGTKLNETFLNFLSSQQGCQAKHASIYVISVFNVLPQNFNILLQFDQTAFFKLFCTKKHKMASK